jgi:hypothetical protein
MTEELTPRHRQPVVVGYGRDGGMGALAVPSSVMAEGERTAVDCVARVSGAVALSPTRVSGHARRTYSGRPSRSMRFSPSAARTTSVARRPSLRERKASSMTRIQREGIAKLLGL